DDVEKQILLKNVLKKNLNSNPFSRFTAILELKDAVTALSPTDRWKVEAYLENTYGGLDLAVDRPTRDQFNRLVAPGGILFNTDGTRFQNPFRQLLASPDDVEANFLADVDASPDRAMIRNILQSAFGTSRTNFNDSMTSQVEKYILHNYGILYDSVGDPLLRPLAPFEAIVKTIKDAEGSQETRDRLEQLGVDVNDGISFEEFSILTQGPAGDPALIIEVGFLLKRLREPDPRTQELVNLKNFNHLFGADIQATGTLKGEEPELLFGIVGTPDLEKTVEIDEAYNEDNFLKILTPASNLLTELEKPGNETFLADFNSIFGTGITTGVNDLNAYDRKVLLDIVGAASFNLDRFKLALPKAKLLLTYLTTVATSTDLANFNGFFGTSITAISIPVNLRVEWGAFFDATEVMDLASDVEIKELIAAIPKAELFLTYLTTIATSADLATFNRLFGASITATSTVANLGDDRGALFDATEAMKTASNVELIEFFRVLPLAARLLVALQSDPVALDGFNMVFGANLVRS
ncbi:MAG: hypothetical protein HYT89_02550, partial [Candidatus Omnitrophica bacterium]|nr:hypothetical protein [Candidatus Omnitrophota bacterium]